MAAIAGFEEALSSPMVHSTDCAPIAATIRDSSFGSLVPGFAPSFHDSMIRPDCADMMSAFAAAAAAASPTCPPQDLAGAFGHQTMDAAAAVAAAVAAEECNQALVEAFGRYYAESALEGTPDMQFPFCEWSDVIAGDRDAGVSTAITAMELASGAAPGVRHASTSDSAVATVRLACDNSPVVIDWLNNLKNILDIDSHLFADSACQDGPLFEDGGGQTWPFVFAHHDL
ncbi:hypothetical protein GGF42_005488 [Coemansia sp. RSA 2424]|nr:hypothetical protein GGF42_005488 [Coemansia sp. RSA 2424]